MKNSEADPFSCYQHASLQIPAKRRGDSEMSCVTNPEEWRSHFGTNGVNLYNGWAATADIHMNDNRSKTAVSIRYCRFAKRTEPYASDCLQVLIPSI